MSNVKVKVDTYDIIEDQNSVQTVDNACLDKVASLLESIYDRNYDEVLTVDESYLDELRKQIADLGYSEKSLKITTLKDDEDDSLYHINVGVFVPKEYRVALKPPTYTLDITHLVLQCVTDFDKEYFMNYIRVLICGFRSTINCSEIARIIAMAHNLVMSITDDTAPSNMASLSMKDIDMSDFLNSVSKYLVRCSMCSNQYSTIAIASSPYTRDLMDALMGVANWFAHHYEEDNEYTIQTLNEARGEYLNFLGFLAVNFNLPGTIHANYLLNYYYMRKNTNHVDVRVGTYDKDSFYKDPTLIKHFEGYSPLTDIKHKRGILGIAYNVCMAQYNMEYNIYAAKAKSGGDILLNKYDPDKQQRKFCKTSGECLLNELVIELYALDDDKNTDLCSYIYNLFNEIPYYEVLYAGGYKFDENDVTGYIESLIARKTSKEFN